MIFLNQGLRMTYDDFGSGFPILFVHGHPSIEVCGHRRCSLCAGDLERLLQTSEATVNRSRALTQSLRKRNLLAILLAYSTIFPLIEHAL